MDYDCETNNMNQVYCCQCQRNFRLGFDELYSEQLIGDDYAEDGSLIPSYNYTCSTCYFKGQPASIGKINATAIDILRKVDNLQKDLDRVKQQQTTDSKILFKIFLVVTVMPWVCLMAFHFIIL